MPKQKAGKARAKKSAPYDKSTKLNEEDVSREPENGQEDEEILKCDKCKGSVEGLIQCESCMLWHCCSCGNFPFETVEVVKVCKTLHWYCEPCDNTANAQNHSDQLLTNIERSITLCLEKVSDNLITLAKQQLSCAGPPSNQSPMETETTVISAQSSSQVNPPPHKPNNYEKISSSQHDRKYNMVVFGIAEPPSESSPFARTAKDTENITKLFEKINSDFCSATLRDCFRLGHYKKDQTRPQPILVKLNRTVDVANILSNRAKYPNEINIKPDLTKEERSCESKLLAERWCLMQSGIDKKLIKIRKSSIYIQGKLHGSVQNSSFCPVDQPPANLDTNLEPPSNSHSSSDNTTTPAGAGDSNI